MKYFKIFQKNNGTVFPPFFCKIHKNSNRKTRFWYLIEYFYFISNLLAKNPIKNWILSLILFQNPQNFQIQGQCFMSTVKVQASNTVCPWCVDDSQTTTTTTVTPAPPSTTFSPFFGTSNNTSLLIGMLILAFFSLLALTSTTVLLCVYISDRKKPEFFDMPLPQANSTVLGGRR